MVKLSNINNLGKRGELVYEVLLSSNAAKISLDRGCSCSDAGKVSNKWSVACCCGSGEKQKVRQVTQIPQLPPARNSHL